MYWSQQFSNIKIQVKNELSQDHVTLRHISLAFYIRLCFLPFSIPILLFEILFFKQKNSERLFGPKIGPK